MIPLRRSSGTSPPFSISGPATRPSAVPAAMASRSMSPVEILGTRRWPARRPAWVPLPAPGGPRKMTRAPIAGSGLGLASATDPSPLARSAEAFVVAHDELRLHLGDRVHGHADDDQERGAAEIEVEAEAFRDPAQVVVGQEVVEAGPDDGDGRDLEAGDEELGKDGDEGQVDGAPEGDAAQDVVQVFGGTLPRADAGHEAPVLPHVLRHVVRVEDDRGVEVAEEDDEGDVEEVVERHPPGER